MEELQFILREGRALLLEKHRHEVIPLLDRYNLSADQKNIEIHLAPVTNIKD
jgi:hypothetical protein